MSPAGDKTGGDSAMFAQLFNELNLDDLSTDPADYDKAAEVLNTLAVYARDKGRAMKARAEGDVALATLIERRLDALYSALPESAKW